MSGAAKRWFPVLGHAGVANAITTANALAGVVGLYFAARGAPLGVLVCGALAIPCDVLDGVVARRTGTASAFGAQLDSLADAVSFVLLPASLAVALGAPVATLFAALAFAVAGLLRLARFGVVGVSVEGARETFEGVPTVFCAAWLTPVVAASLWLPGPARAPVLTVFYLLSAATMVSALPFPKRGPHTRLLWGLVPAALAVVWVKLR